MNIDIPYYFFKLFERDTTTFVYQGEFGDDLTDKTIRLGEYSIRNILDFKRLKNRVAFLITECVQNVIRYEEKPKIVHQTNNRPGTFIVRNIGNSFYLISSNLIKNEKVDALKAKLKKINELGQVELKEMQRRLLIDEQPREKESTELGLIELTRRSGHKLEYDFEFVNSYLSDFHLQVKLSVNEGMNAYKDKASMIKGKDLYHKILDKNVLVLYKGDFSQQSMHPVLGMIESNLKRDAEKYYLRKKVFYLLVELLQNMSKHALEKNGSRQGIVVISKKNQNYYIYSGNFISLPKAEALKSYLNKIYGMNKDQLSILYTDQLLDGNTRPKGGAGLGLIDMIRYSTDKPSFNFSAHDAESVFFSFGFSI